MRRPVASSCATCSPSTSVADGSRTRALLDRLASEKLQAVAAEVMADGWQWVDVALSHPYGHTSGLHRLSPTEVALTEEESARWEALRAEYEQLQADHEGGGDLPEDVDARLAEIEQEIEALDERRAVFTPEAKAIGGVFISIGHEGVLKIERGFVRREDMPALSPAQDDAESSDVGAEAFGPGVERATFTVGGAPDDVIPAQGEPEEEDPDRPISDRLMLELTTVHTLALRGALADDPDAAFVAVLHAMVLKVFYNAYTIDTCLEIQTRTSSPDRSIDGLAEFAPAAAILCRKEAWAEQLPRQPKALWDYLVGLDGNSRASLFALCAGLSVNAMQEFHNRRPDAIAHGRRLAEFVGLDMAQHWEPTAANFFSRVTKARILNAVRDVKGEASAQLIDHLKKVDMAKEAERLLAGSGWLPQPLRTPGRDRAALPIAEGAMPETEAPVSSASVPVAPGVEALPAFLAGDDEPAGEGSAPEAAKGLRRRGVRPWPGPRHLRGGSRARRGGRRPHARRPGPRRRPLRHRRRVAHAGAVERRPPISPAVRPASPPPRRVSRVQEPIMPDYFTPTVVQPARARRPRRRRSGPPCSRTTRAASRRPPPGPARGTA